jgi:dephospho-CoA kinase
MIEVALTGCPFSGKKRVAKLFKQIKVPVFEADTVIKFILNFRPYVDDPIRANVGSFVYKNGFLNPDAFVTDSLFDKTIDIIEFELFQVWERFKQKHSGSSYVIFKSSILFERGWETKFDQIISVFAPKEERVLRAKTSTNLRVDFIWSTLDKGIPDLTKNKKSTYVIHNYESGPELLSQVNNVDTKIIETHLRTYRKSNVSMCGNCDKLPQSRFGLCINCSKKYNLNLL